MTELERLSYLRSVRKLNGDKIDEDKLKVVLECAYRSVFFFSSRRRHTRCSRDWSSDVCSSDLLCLTCAANHGPRRRARHPSRGRVPRTGARRLRERGLPAVPHALLAGRERWDAEIGRASCRERG